MCYREIISASPWSVIVFLIPDLSVRKRNTAVATKLFNILSGQTREYLQRVSSAACYSRTPEWICLHTTEKSRS